MDYTESARARRFRDRRRIRQRALDIARRQHPRPFDLHRDHSTGELVSLVSWKDLKGQAQKGLTSWNAVIAFREAMAIRRWQHPAVCSCLACGNPRKWFDAATRQETLAAVDALEQFAEVGLNFRSRFRAFS